MLSETTGDAKPVMLKFGGCNGLFRVSKLQWECGGEWIFYAEL